MQTRYYHITTNDKKLIKGRIDYLFRKSKKDYRTKLLNEFGADVLTLIDKVILDMFVDRLINCKPTIRYIDIYEQLEKNLGFIFDINEYETVKDFWFSDKGSIFTPDDAKEIDGGIQ